ncbi:MAG: hypothetical protein DLM58_14445 [Pseudonocardiales bacterium]|nr:MAG: hypothetical protein DLM58_14445 [Pseudonocardiales bacterium]
MPDALNTMGWIHLERGDLDTARAFFDEALACFAAQEKDARADLDSEDSLAARHNIACTLRFMGRPEEAVQQFRWLRPMSIEMNQLYHLIVLCEDYAAALAETGALASAARLIGGADQLRIRHALHRPQVQESELEPAISALKAGLGEHDWAVNFAIGMTTPIDVLLSRA